MRGMTTVNGKSVAFGFVDFDDWIRSVVESFPAPWKVADLDGKYFGTEIQDARGISVLSVWLSYGEPSIRQRDGRTDAEWQDYCCDCHWESTTALCVARAITEARNQLSVCRSWETQELWAVLRALLNLAEWAEDVWPDIRAGGPLRRALPTDPCMSRLPGIK